MATSTLAGVAPSTAQKVNRLKLSNDRKVSPRSKWAVAAKRWEPMVPNSFGLPAGISCPGKTAFCEGCYAENIERAFPSVSKLTHHNLDLLLACGSNVSAMAELLGEAIDAYRAAHLKAEKRQGESIPMVFRIHWDGDFFSFQYASAWARVIRANADVTFWAYTRSFAYVGALAGLANLSLYLSVDEHNADEAQDTHELFPWARLAFCAATWDETETLARKVSGRNAPRCPELAGKMPLVSTDGVGACVDCGLCFRGTNNVRFSVDH